MSRSTRTKLFLFIVICSAACTPALAEIYQWTDKHGNTVFGDSPPKNKDATSIDIPNTEKSGTRFASPAQVKELEHEAKNPSPKPQPKQARVDAQCRRYLSELNKVELFLEHTNSPRDQHKANDLRKLIEKECSKEQLAQKFDDWRCQRYREDLSKTELFLEHSNNPRDERKAERLRQQIARECR